jgi:hypothetical protein
MYQYTIIYRILFFDRSSPVCSMDPGGHVKIQIKYILFIANLRVQVSTQTAGMMMKRSLTK